MFVVVVVNISDSKLSHNASLVLSNIIMALILTFFTSLNATELKNDENIFEKESRIRPVSLK
jgi:hypothetical protein